MAAGAKLFGQWTLGLETPLGESFLKRIWLNQQFPFRSWKPT